MSDRTMKTILGFSIGCWLSMWWFDLEWEQAVPLFIGLTIGHLLEKRQQQ